ncbi:MAG: DUF6677 family protein [Thermoguttaceae bacterium]|jgi:hypothetical protein
MTEERTANKNSEEKIDLRNPALAGFLAWLFPGAGHFFQRRYFKAAVYGFSIWILLISGLVMGSYRAPIDGADGASKLFFARTVYCSWRVGDKRLAFIPQACVGVMAIPAIMQANANRDGDASFWSTAFAPPQIASDARERPNQPTLNEIAGNLHSWFELSTFYTVTAGLFNLLAFFDAIGGPVIARNEEDTRKRKKKGKKEETPVAAQSAR